MNTLQSMTLKDKIIDMNDNYSMTLSDISKNLSVHASTATLCRLVKSDDGNNTSYVVGVAIDKLYEKVVAGEVQPTLLKRGRKKGGKNAVKPNPLMNTRYKRKSKPVVSKSAKLTPIDANNDGDNKMIADSTQS